MKYILLTPFILLVACQPSIDPQPQPGERHRLDIEWRIVDRAELEATYLQAGHRLTEKQSLRGFAGVLPDGSRVVYTLPPVKVDDDPTCTLGHEIMHLTHGDYHQ